MGRLATRARKNTRKRRSAVWAGIGIAALLCIAGCAERRPKLQRPFERVAPGSTDPAEPPSTASETASAAKCPPFTFVHLTDSHCVTTTLKPAHPPLSAQIEIAGYKFHWLDKPNSFAILEDTVRYINQVVKPDFVIHTGDITDTGDLNDMKKAKHVLDGLDCKYYTVMGDHDSGIRGATSEKDKKRPNYVKVFGERCYSFNHNGWHFVCLGIFPSVHEMVWLKTDLEKNKDHATILCTHRLVVADEFTVALAKGHYGTELMMPRAAQVEALLRDSPQVIVVLSGHCHSNFHWQKHGTHFISTSASSGTPVQFRLFKVHKDRIEIGFCTAHAAAAAKEGNWSCETFTIVPLRGTPVRQGTTR